MISKKIEEAVKRIKPLDEKLLEQTQKRLDNLTKPLGSLGRLEELAKQVVAITGKEKPELKKKVIFTLAGDHGVVEEGVSCYPKEVTPQMVYNFLRGGAGINVLARHVGAKVVVADIGVAEKIDVTNPEFKDKKINFGTKNFTKGPAMTEDKAVKSIEAGIELVEEELKNGIDIIGTGDMGIANTTPSSAITSVICGVDVEKVTGRGTGIDDKMLKNKIASIKKAIALNKPDKKDGIDILSKIGGFEIGGLTGIILAGASHKIPVVIDGFISGAAALLAYTFQPTVVEYLIASHCSVEQGHKIILKHLGLKPVLDLNLRLGEGTGAALGINIVVAGCKILAEMATFENAGVSKKME
ncbi:MAG: nicotinate-nucleotide--dimethylbenzimidazole phosphoribosyltransferase [Elusimicrobia bacterium]|nr:nicotinate-nucleotide--dimethylbenzimidazole phosphoribosyltransferase [Elusimicrobiota bacterium]